ncbi:hypothetical protein INT43_001589 [Umbelopsis isabellina]|uniref:N-acetyltransferase domain-containing protein n=1 Tax=Mortierella isabellina TaxID=91625 RepID=A0A8H7PRA2_MORIS|nr:hypothetical protein INT43_001589 [Umbelopsis isabellina]
MTHEQAPIDLSHDTTHSQPTLKEATNGSETTDSTADFARKSTRTRSTRRQTGALKDEAAKSSGGTSEDRPAASEQALKRTRKNAGNNHKTNQLTNKHAKDANTASKAEEQSKINTRIIPTVRLNASKTITGADVIHDDKNMLFKIILDDKGTAAALCYLPTRFRGIIEFYHTEIPLEYRSRGIGDLIAHYAFQWAENNNYQVLPTCSFLQRHLKHQFPDEQGLWSCVIHNEQEGLNRIAKSSTSQPAPSSQS